MTASSARCSTVVTGTSLWRSDGMLMTAILDTCTGHDSNGQFATARHRWEPFVMTEVPHVVAVLGRGVVDPDEPVVTADDLGLTRGDGCFDSLRVFTDENGRATAVDLEEHLDRLDRSAGAMNLDNPPHARWRELVEEALAAWSTPGEAVLKLPPHAWP